MWYIDDHKLKNQGSQDASLGVRTFIKQNAHFDLPLSFEGFANLLESKELRRVLANLRVPMTFNPWVVGSIPTGPTERHLAGEVFRRISGPEVRFFPIKATSIPFWCLTR